MKHYIDPVTKVVFAYEEDGSQDGFIKPNLVSISESDLASVRESQIDTAAMISGRIAKLRTMREEVLNRLTGIASRADRKGDKATADACDVATQDLLDITKDLPAELAEIELTVFARYQALVSTAALASPSLVSAFMGVDL